jgi:hypothetical protein
MSLFRKVSVLTLVMIALIIPAAALSQDAAGEAELRDNGIWVSGGFNDRGSGTITVRVFNTGTDVAVVNVKITGAGTDNVYATGTAAVPGDPGSGFGSVDVPLSFRIGDPGRYWVDVHIESVSGSGVNEAQSVTVFEFEVRQSIWSNTWTYVAIILVIVIAGIGLFIKFRGAPKVEDTGSFTAMEEERKASKRSTGKEEYKGRNEKK